MKCITYLLLPFAATAFFGCGSDDNGESEDDPYERPEEAQMIITDAQLDDLVAIGITINPGSAAPELAGVYDRADGSVVAADNEASVGLNACDNMWTVEETEEPYIYATSSEDYNNCDGSRESPASYISGRDNCFTLYVENDGDREGCDFRWAQVISGCLEDGGIEDYQEADLGIEHDDSSACQSLIDEGAIPGAGQRALVEYPFVERQ